MLRRRFREANFPEMTASYPLGQKPNVFLPCVAKGRWHGMAFLAGIWVECCLGFFKESHGSASVSVQKSQS